MKSRLLYFVHAAMQLKDQPGNTVFVVPIVECQPQK